MPERVDVVIVGGGAMGASTAFWLSRLDPALSITVLEPDPSYRTASTALSAASIRQQFSTRVNVEISRFGIQFIKNISEYINLPDIPHALDLIENGYLFLAGSPETAAAMRESAALQHQAGAATELLDRTALGHRFPLLATDDVTLASFGATDEGWFDNMALLQALRRGAMAGSARFLRQSATGFVHDGDRVTGVRLSGGSDLSAGATVVAAGRHAARVLCPLDPALPVEPRKRTVFFVDAPDARWPEAPLIVDHLGYYARPEREGWICGLIAPLDDAAADPDDFSPDLTAFEDQIWPALYARMPAFAACRVKSAWAGHYAFNTFDQNALIGRHPDWRDLYVLAGFSGHGLQQAPAIGRGIAELIVEGRYVTLDLTDLDLGRLRAGRRLRERAIV